MPDESELTPAERELEKALSGLKPTGLSIDRDRLMFQAGKRSMRGNLRLWRGVAAILVACLGLSLALRPEPRQEVRLVDDNSSKRQMHEQQAEFASTIVWPRPRHTPAGSYIRLQRLVLAKGLDALPSRKSAKNLKPEIPLSIEDLLKEINHTHNNADHL